jgi:hypothetical protein
VNSPGNGVTLTRCPNLHVAHVRVEYANRGNTSAVGVGFYQVSGFVQKYTIRHDSNNTGWKSVEIGSGNATDPAAVNFRALDGTYANTLNQAGNDVTIQSGTFAPVDYVYELATRNGGEASVVTRTVRLGKTATRVERFIGSGAPGALSGAVGSTYTDTATGTQYVMLASGWTSQASPTPKIYKQTSATTTPSATANTLGAAVTLTPDTGYASIQPQFIVTTIANIGSESVTATITATYDDATTNTFNQGAVTVNGSTTAPISVMPNLFKDGRYIVSIGVQIKSSIAASTATGTVQVSGYNTN